VIPAQRHRVVPAQLACRIGARAQAGERNAWPAVVPIALGSFAPVFSEGIPVGLLADISGQLRVSIGTGGPMVVVPAVAAAFAAGVTVRSHLRATLMGSGLLIAASALLLAAVTGARPLTSRWWPPGGLGFGAVPVAAQSWMARAMPSNVEGGLALFVSALQGSLAAGSAADGGHL
jgi:predicted MFS family arabinose efflux permease